MHEMTEHPRSNHSLRIETRKICSNKSVVFSALFRCVASMKKSLTPNTLITSYLGDWHQWYVASIAPSTAVYLTFFPYPQVFPTSDFPFMSCYSVIPSRRALLSHSGRSLRAKVNQMHMYEISLAIRAAIFILSICGTCIQFLMEFGKVNFHRFECANVLCSLQHLNNGWIGWRPSNTYISCIIVYVFVCKGCCRWLRGAVHIDYRLNSTK